MRFDPSLDELVVFELPDRRLAGLLLAQLSPKRFAWMQNADEIPVVAALLNPDELDLAVLLRGVQAWLKRVKLAGIRFELDGRMYVLEAGSRVFLPF